MDGSRSIPLCRGPPSPPALLPHLPSDKILSKMGEGTFGRVLECWDRKHKVRGRGREGAQGCMSEGEGEGRRSRVHECAKLGGGAGCF